MSRLHRIAEDLEASRPTAFSGMSFQLRQLVTDGVFQVCWAGEREGTSPQFLLAQTRKAPRKWCELADVLVHESIVGHSNGRELLTCHPGCGLVLVRQASGRCELHVRGEPVTTVRLPGWDQEAVSRCAVLSAYFVLTTRSPSTVTADLVAQVHLSWVVESRRTTSSRAIPDPRAGNEARHYADDRRPDTGPRPPADTDEPP